MSGNDFGLLRARYHVGDENTDRFFALGTGSSVCSGRISYFFGLKGPSITLDTACSSSMSALHSACLSLKSNDCEMAIVGGVNVILAPDVSVAFSKVSLFNFAYKQKAGMLSPSGRCKTMDKGADGYVRSEGCGVVLLKPLSRAIKDGNQVMAVILGTAITQDGGGTTFTAPNGPSQERTIVNALERAGINAEKVNVLELHGTGTNLGDIIELNAVKNVFSKERKDELIIGAVKSNIGTLFLFTTFTFQGTQKLHLASLLSLKHFKHWYIKHFLQIVISRNKIPGRQILKIFQLFIRLHHIS